MAPSGPCGRLCSEALRCSQGFSHPHQTRGMYPERVASVAVCAAARGGSLSFSPGPLLWGGVGTPHPGLHLRDRSPLPSRSVLFAG